MEGEESRLRYVDSQVKTVYRSKASTWVDVPTAHRCTNTHVRADKTHDMTTGH